MTLGELLQEGVALSRPCFLLAERRGERLAAYWGGERADRPNIVPAAAAAIASWTHILTLDPGLFADLGLHRVADPIGLFAAELRAGGRFMRAERAPVPAFPQISCSGGRLFATPASSFPPFQAVCLYGGEAVGLWRDVLGLERHQYEEALGEEVAEAYQAEFTRRAPFYAAAADVIVGGWHMMWPEDDFFLPREMRLLATTVRDAEPYREIWLSESGNISVKERIPSHKARMKDAGKRAAATRKLSASARKAWATRRRALG